MKLELIALYFINYLLECRVLRKIGIDHAAGLLQRVMKREARVQVLRDMSLHAPVEVLVQ